MSVNLDPLQIVQFIPFISVFAAIAGLMLTALVIKKNTKALQLGILQNTFSIIHGLEKELYDKYTDVNADKRKNWDSLFFNAIEYLAFMVNRRYLPYKDMASFFEDAIKHWYEGIFLKHYTTEDIADEKKFPEMKRLYKRIETE